MQDPPPSISDKSVLLLSAERLHSSSAADILYTVSMVLTDGETLGCTSYLLLSGCTNHRLLVLQAGGALIGVQALGVIKDVEGCHKTLNPGFQECNKCCLFALQAWGCTDRAPCPRGDQGCGGGALKP